MVSKEEKSVDDAVQEDAISKKERAKRGPVGSASTGPPPKSRGPQAPIRLASANGYLVNAGPARRQAWQPRQEQQEWRQHWQPRQQARPKPARGDDRRQGINYSSPVCKVTSASEVHHTAGFIANNLRTRSPVPLQADSAAATNQAMKALALTRSFLSEEGSDLSVKVMHRGAKGSEEVELLVTLVTDSWVRRAIRHSDGSELFVSAQSDPGKVAGSIAKQVRQDIEVQCTACGPSAVFCATQAVYLAQEYLSADAGCELSFAPAFGKSKEGPNLLYFHVFKGFKECKVSAESDVHQTAGYIAAGVRAGCPPVVLAKSAAAVNQAVKSLALARSFLESEGLGIIARPDFPEYREDEDTELVRFELLVDPGSWVSKSINSRCCTELYVASESDAKKVAGSIAKFARNSQETYCTAMGAQAVLCAMKSIYLCRRYLVSEAPAVRASFAARFDTPTNASSILQLTVLIEWE